MGDSNFGGSIWCNVAIALSHVETLYKHETQSLGLTVIEWYILRTLYQQDGQIASQLARAVGRTPASFSPTIDAIERKGFIQRHIHPSNRRSVRIYLTTQGRALEQQVTSSANRIESKIRQQFSDKEWQIYERVIENFQVLTPSEVMLTKRKQN